MEKPNIHGPEVFTGQEEDSDMETFENIITDPKNLLLAGAARQARQSS